MKSWWYITGFSLLVGLRGFTIEPGYELEPVFYSESEPVTPLTKIRDRIKKGEKLLAGKTNREILRELLELLEIPVSSQVLVYSKTSAQNSRISPDRPRAIYFSDNAYVGWVQYGNIEVITFDENLGMVFHLVDLNSRIGGAPPKFIRDRSCLNCHGGSSTRNWPGLVVRSVYPQEDGQPIYHAGTFRTNHGSPLSERWGGWYVTGDSSGQEHLGNIIAQENPETKQVTYQPISTQVLKTLNGQFPTSPYLGGGVSDLVSLMILEHQVTVHNALVEGNLVMRQTRYRHRKMREAFGEPVDSPFSETNQRVIEGQVDRIVKALLFSEEHIMKENGVEGSPAFQESFVRNARKTKDHRSLKDLRLYERLFKYRCSFLIYSDAFNHLPAELKERVLMKLKGVLTGKITGVGFDHLGDTERKRIEEILAETLPNWGAI